MALSQGAQSGRSVMARRVRGRAGWGHGSRRVRLRRRLLVQASSPQHFPLGFPRGHRGPSQTDWVL